MILKKATFPLFALLAFPLPLIADATAVTIKPLSDIQIYPHHSAPATTVSLNESVVSAQLNARITKVAVRVGDHVKKHQLLVKLDCRDSELVRLSAAARMKLAEKELARANQLKKSSSIAISNLNQRQTEVTQAKVAHQQANLQVERCTIKAPYNAVVMERIASTGSLAAPGTPLVRLIDTERLELKSSVSAQDVKSLQSANTVHFTNGDSRYPVKLRAMIPLLDAQSNNRNARFSFISAKPLSGTSGRLEWRESRHHLPASLLLERNGELGIFVAKDNIAQFIALENASTGQDVIVSLPANTSIIIDGRFGLQADDVIVVNQ